MKSSVIEVSGLFSALCAQGVEKRLRELPGVERAAVSYVTGTATVTYDETKTDLRAIRARIGDCGYHCSGEVLPKHVCRHDNPTAVTAQRGGRGGANVIVRTSGRGSPATGGAGNLRTPPARTRAGCPTDW